VKRSQQAASEKMTFVRTLEKSGGGEAASFHDQQPDSDATASRQESGTGQARPEIRARTQTKRDFSNRLGFPVVNAIGRDSARAVLNPGVNIQEKRWLSTGMVGTDGDNLLPKRSGSILAGIQPENRRKRRGNAMTSGNVPVTLRGASQWRPARRDGAEFASCSGTGAGRTRSGEETGCGFCGDFLEEARRLRF